MKIQTAKEKKNIRKQISQRNKKIKTIIVTTIREC